MKKTQRSLLIDKFIQENLDLSNADLATALKNKFGETYSESGVRVRRHRAMKTNIEVEQKPVQTYVERKQEAENKSALRKEANQLIEENTKLRREHDALLQIQSNLKSTKIEKPKGSDESYATAIALLSDMHIEETIVSEKVSGLNKYNLTIAEKRMKEFFINTLKLTKKEQQDVKIDTLILAILGDAISGNIHAELLENCSLRPIEAIILAQEWIISGIQYILDNSELKLVIPCCVGNHTRITHKVHLSTEQGNSLEYFMYHSMRKHFEKNKRVEFIVGDGYFIHLNVYGYTLAFSHGHAIKYGGGIGNLFIPAYKAISQWQKGKPADYYFWGHFHSFKFGGNFICNGSIIGYSPFALSIKADFEKPKQVFCLIDEKRGLTGIFPILFSI